MKDYNKNETLILDGEESFARAVALGIIVKRPPSAWHFLLPGMFLFDFLRRNSEMRRYSDLFLFPRRLALKGALDIINGEDRKEILSQIGNNVKHWLVSLNHYSESLQCKHMDVIDLLIDHYSRLLHAEGNDYTGLIKDAYKVLEFYKTYLHRLSTAEQAVDHAIAEIQGEAKDIMEKLRMEQVQVTELRTKEVNRVFSRTGE